MAGLAALAISYVLSQFYRSFLAVLTPALTVELGASHAQLSIASGTWFATFALMQFVVGVSLDRYGPRRTAAVLLAVAGGGGALLFSVANAPWMVIAAMGLIGIGCSPVLMASVYIFARSYSPARLAIMMSWMIAIGTAGNVIGASPLAAAAEAFGWRHVMVGLALVTLATAFAVLILVRDPRDPAGEQASSGFGGYLELLRIRALWPIIFIIAFNYAPAAGIRGLWAGPYLADVYGADALTIGNATLFMALAMVAGAFLYGPMDTLLGTRKWVVFWGNVPGLLAVGSLALFPQTTIVTATIHLVAIGLFGAAYGILMAQGRAFIPAHLTGRGVTLLNFFSIAGVGIAQFASAPIYAAASQPGQPAAAYSALFAFYALLLGGALVIYLWSKDAPPERPLPGSAR